MEKASLSRYEALGAHHSQFSLRIIFFHGDVITKTQLPGCSSYKRLVILIIDLPSTNVTQSLGGRGVSSDQL